MIDAVTNKNSIFYKERINFDFLLQEDKCCWFSSGTIGLYRLALDMIACYTAERKLNYLNDLTEFIQNHYDVIMKIHGETLKFIVEDNRDYFGTYLCAAIMYNLNNEMRLDLSASLLNFLKLINLTSYYDKRFFEQNTTTELERMVNDYYNNYVRLTNYNRTINVIYDTIHYNISDMYIRNIIDENSLSFNSMKIVIYNIMYYNKVRDIFYNNNNTKIVRIKIDETNFDDCIKEITMLSYECVHKIMCSM